MMKSILPRKIIPQILAISFAFVSCISSAYTVNVTVKGSKVTYDNAYNISSNNLVTSDWSIINENMYPTSEWQPGLLSMLGSSFTVSGGGINIDVPIKVVGAQFGMYSNSTGQGSPIFNASSTCQFSVDGTTVSLYNTASTTDVGYSPDSCSAPNSVKINENQPFYFVKPIFQLDEDELLNALKTVTDGSSVTPGTVFVGTLPTSLKYYFRYNNTNTVRNLPSESFTLRITYTKDELLDVDLTPFREITPQYDPSTNTAKGEVEFDVKLYGTISAGIKMTFMKRDYIMTHKGLFSEVEESTTAPDGYVLTEDGYTNASKGIKYYVKCNSLCNTADMESGYIVKDGALARDQSQMVVRVNAQGSTGDPDMAYKLQVGYENLPATDVISGLYMDTFTIMFELDY